MKRWLATVMIFGVSSAVVRADVTVVQTTTMEGGVAAMAGGGMSPKMTNRVKGMKSRSDIELPSVNASSITDLVANQMIFLRHDQKTAQVAGAAASTTTVPATASVKLDAALAPTGKSQVIDGFKCDEYTFTTTMTMADMAGSQMPPEAAGMLKDLSVIMKGSMWVAKDVPGAAEYIAFQKALAKSDLASAAVKASGVNIPGIDKMLKAMGAVDGLTYLTVMDLTIEGSGQVADMMRQMGAMKITTRVTSISTDPVSDDMFKVPEGYTVIK
ncbi:MAG TPA: hypothetical protein VF921_13765 [Vicinamibacterales bacterium]